VNNTTQNAQKLTILIPEIQKILKEGAQPPSQTPSPVGRETPPHHTPPLGAFGASILAPSAPTSRLCSDKYYLFYALLHGCAIFSGRVFSPFKPGGDIILDT